MKLYIMRHGPAEDDSTSGRDEDRELTQAGRQRVIAVAKTLKAEGELPARLIASPLVRTAQTAALVAEVASLNAADVGCDDDLQPGGDASDVVERAAASSSSLMVIGHEPDLTQLVRRLVGKDVPVFMDKATVVGLELVPGRGGPTTKVGLRFVLEPKSLKFELDRRSDGK